MKKKLVSILKLVGLFLLFFSITSIPILIFNIDITKLSDLELIVYSFCCNILFLVVIISCYIKTIKKDFKPFFKNFWKIFEESFKYYIIGLGIMILSNLIIGYILKGGVAANEEIVRNQIELAPFLMFLEVAIYAPIAEELLFRKSFREVINNKWLYILISGFIFGGLHVIGNNKLIELLYLIPYCSLGFTFSYIYAKTDNIYSTITVHSLHNTITILLFLIGANI